MAAENIYDKRISGFTGGALNITTPFTPLPTYTPSAHASTPIL